MFELKHVEREVRRAGEVVESALKAAKNNLWFVILALATLFPILLKVMFLLAAFS